MCCVCQLPDHVSKRNMQRLPVAGPCIREKYAASARCWAMYQIEICRVCQLPGRVSERNMQRLPVAGPSIREKYEVSASCHAMYQREICSVCKLPGHVSERNMLHLPVHVTQGNVRHLPGFSVLSVDALLVCLEYTVRALHRVRATHRKGRRAASSRIFTLWFGD